MQRRNKARDAAVERGLLPMSYAFSLLEVMLALTIVGIFLTISLPMTKHFFDGVQDNLLQSQLLRTIQQAKQMAYIRRLPIALCHSKDFLTCSGHWIDGQLIFVDENEDGVIQTKEQILTVVQNPIHHGILYFRSYPRYRGYLLFLPTALMAHDNGTFWYCHSEKESPVWAMVLSQSGNIRVQYPDSSGEIKDTHGVPLTCVASHKS